VIDNDAVWGFLQGVVVASAFAAVFGPWVALAAGFAYATIRWYQLFGDIDV
jgi:hypothetical protein